VAILQATILDVDELCSKCQGDFASGSVGGTNGEVGGFQLADRDNGGRCATGKRFDNVTRFKALFPLVNTDGPAFNCVSSVF